jgi:hypothetical protein
MERRLRSRLKPTNDSWRVDETYIRVKGKWVYLYRAVDSTGATIGFLVSAKRDTVATTIEELRQSLQLERRLIARLKTANIRFTDAQIERIWAIVSAHQAGLSIRKIARATGLSSSRIHQLLNAPEAKQIPPEN